MSRRPSPDGVVAYHAALSRLRPGFKSRSGRHLTHRPACVIEVIQRGVLFPSQHGPQSIDCSELVCVGIMEAGDLLATSPMLEDRYPVPDIVVDDVATVSELNELGLVESEVHHPELLGLPQPLYQAVYVLRGATGAR